MGVRYVATLIVLMLTLAACGQGGESGTTEGAQETQSTPADSVQDAQGSEPELPEPEAVMEGSGDASDEIWTLIQENHGNLTDQQQRSLQACARLAVEDEGAVADRAVQQCRQEMEDMAEEKQEEDSGEGRDGNNAKEGEG